MDALMLNLPANGLGITALTAAEPIAPDARDAAAQGFAALLNAELEAVQPETDPLLAPSDEPATPELSAAQPPALSALVPSTAPTAPFPAALPHQPRADEAWNASRDTVDSGLPPPRAEHAAQAAATPAPNGSHPSAAQPRVHMGSDSNASSRAPLAAAVALDTPAVAAATVAAAGEYPPPVMSAIGSETPPQGQTAGAATRAPAEAHSAPSEGSPAAPVGFGLAAPEPQALHTRAGALLDVRAPITSHGFADALSRQIVWMMDKDAQVAELRLDPPELGPVQVRLTVKGEDASVSFVSAVPEVRAALEAAVGRLRESMAEAGIQLGEAFVSAQSSGDQREPAPSARDGGGAGPERAAAVQAPWPGAHPIASVPRGLVDVFA